MQTVRLARAWGLVAWAVVVGTCPAPAQQQIWMGSLTHHTGAYIRGLESVPDLDGDGFEDFLVNYNDRETIGIYTTTWEQIEFRSGQDARLLHEWDVFSVNLLAYAGHRDGDSVGDVFVIDTPYTLYPPAPPRCRFISLALQRQLRSVNLPALEAILGAHANLDLDADGQPDLLIQRDQAVEAYATNDAALYVLPATAFGVGASIVDVCPLGNVDGIPGDDYVVMASFGGQKTLWRVSGSSGNATGVAVPLPSTARWVRSGGDVDGDGMDDVVVSTNATTGGMAVVVSAATGLEIFRLTNLLGASVNPAELVDVDLDGSADVVYGDDSYTAWSSRDRAVLQSLASPGWPGYTRACYLRSESAANYPLLVRSFVASIAAAFAFGVRLAPVGASIDGFGCSNRGAAPSIGLRPAGPTALRVQAGGAPPGALWWCAIDGAGSLPGPVALDALGLVGCAQQVGLASVSAGLVGSAGIDRGYAALTVPRVLAATGSRFEAQWLFLDPPTGEYAMTARHTFTVR